MKAVRVTLPASGSSARQSAGNMFTDQRYPSNPNYKYSFRMQMKKQK